MCNVKAPTPMQKNPTSTTSLSGSAQIVRHCCKGMGYIMRDCPSKRAYVATDDVGYVSASDEENKFVHAFLSTWFHKLYFE